MRSVRARESVAGRRAVLALGVAASLMAVGSAGFGCHPGGKLPGITLSNRDEGTQVAGAADLRNSPSFRRARVGRPVPGAPPSAVSDIDAGVAGTGAAALTGVSSSSPGKLLVARVVSVNAPTLALEAIPADQQSAFSERVRRNGGGLLSQVVFANPRGPGESATLDSLASQAKAAGARFVLIYEHKTPLTESGSLVYKVVFHSTARGTFYDADRRAALFDAVGQSVGTLGGLTPLQMAVHPHVEPETKRQAVEKLADAVRETLAQASR